MVNTSLRSMFPHHTFVGFDRFFDELEIFTPTSNYPPHNITQEADDAYSIELAVAGFNEKEISVELEKQNLTITGNKAEKDEVNYVHKGISNKSFAKSFRLAENVKVKDVSLLNGMLTIALQIVVPEEDKPIKLAINSGPQLLEG